MSKKCIEGGGSAVYGVGFIGALIYFVSSANEFFWTGFLGIFKALVWPAYMVYYAFKFLLG